MPLKTLSYKRGLVIQDVRSVGWIGIAYLLSLFFALPLQIIMAFTRDEQTKLFFMTNRTNLFSISTEFQMFLTFLVPVLLAIFMFRYMQVKLSSDFVHSLPVKREQLFHTHLVVGTVILLLPILVTGMILTILGTFFPLEELLAGTAILKWMGVTALFNAFVFYAGVFVGMFTGMSVLQGALIYILLLFPVGITVLTFMNLHFHWFGFAGEYYLNQNLERIIPFARFYEIQNMPLTVGELIGYLLFIIFFYVAALFVYKVRNVETATQAIAFRRLQPVFKYGVTFCTMLVGGLYFGATTDESFAWILFGYLAASIIGYVIATMILEKTWRIVKQWKGYALYLFAIVVLGFFLQLDVFGFEKKLPNLEKVERVYFGESIHDLSMENRTTDEGHYRQLRPSFYYEEKGNMENIYQFHQQILQNKHVIENATGEMRTFVFGYKLENGKLKVRQYRIPLDYYEQFYQPIVDSREYKVNKNPILKVEAEAVKQVTFTPRWLGKGLVLTNRDDIQEFHELFLQELEEETYESMQHGDTWAEIEYTLADGVYSHSQWKKSFKGVEAWLEEKDLLEQARVTSNDVAYAIVIKNESGMDIYDFVYGEDLERTIQNRSDTVRIEDPNQIDEALKKASWRNEGTYVIAFYYHQHHFPDFQAFPQDDVPAFIKEQF